MANGQPKQPHRGSQAAAILGMRGPQELLLQMDKRTSDLNEALKKVPVRTIGPQPKLLENVVRLVVFAAIEAREESLVMRIKIEVWLAAQRFEIS